MNLNDLNFNLENIENLLNDNKNIIENEIKKEKKIPLKIKNKIIFKTRKEKKIKKDILNENLNKNCKRKYIDNIWIDKTLDEWNENDYRIYVENLGNEITDDHLIFAFKKYKSFLKAKVIKDKKTGRNKGYGFVSIGNPDDYIKCMKEMNGKYIGRKPIKLKNSKWKSKSLF